MHRNKFMIKDLMSMFALALFVIIATGSIDTDDPDYVSWSGIEEQSKDPDHWKTRDNSSMAYIMMEGFVEKRLKAPRTAKFPGVFDGKLDHVSSIGNYSYRISSYVDSQNGFGALIRTTFVGEIRQVSDDRWQLVSLEFY